MLNPKNYPKKGIFGYPSTVAIPIDPKSVLFST
jgi:hypothetical protein